MKKLLAVLGAFELFVALFISYWAQSGLEPLLGGSSRLPVLLALAMGLVACILGIVSGERGGALLALGAALVLVLTTSQALPLVRRAVPTLADQWQNALQNKKMDELSAAFAQDLFQGKLVSSEPQVVVRLQSGRYAIYYAESDSLARQMCDQPEPAEDSQEEKTLLFLRDLQFAARELDQGLLLEVRGSFRVSDSFGVNEEGEFYPVRWIRLIPKR